MSYHEMCDLEGAKLQHGMNFRLKGKATIILMSLRSDQPYGDRVERGILIYEGHDVARRKGGVDPKTVDQQSVNPNGTLTRNGLFYDAAMRFKRGEGGPELVKVYEKIRPGLWDYKGVFKLADAWQENSNGRKVFKFKLDLMEEV